MGGGWRGGGVLRRFGVGWVRVGCGWEEEFLVGGDLGGGMKKYLCRCVCDSCVGEVWGFGVAEPAGGGSCAWVRGIKVVGGCGGVRCV